MTKDKESLFEVLQIGEKDDFTIDIKSVKPKKIPTKTVSLYLEEMDIRDTINQPFIFIILPFFTSKRQRNVNLVYEIENAGIKFGASLSSDNFEGIKNQQPSDFEKNVFYFILYKFQELLMNGEDADNIVFNIDEIIEYLGLKFSMKYYRKMEETLFNLQGTTYKIAIRNRKKAGNIIREVYKEPLNLIRYEKVKERNTVTNKMKVYYKVTLDKRIIEELRIKHYSIFDRHLLNDLRKADRASEKIYQFISMKRFSSDEGEYRIETLATIIPLTLTSRIKKKLKTGEIKEYEVSKMKQVARRIKKAFDVLVKKKYLLKYEMLELKSLKSYKFRYIFNVEKDNYCHISNLIGNKKTERLKLIELEEPSSSTPKKSGASSAKVGKTQNVMDEVKRAKKNIYVSKAWNKWVDNKIQKIFEENGEEYTVNILRTVYKSLNKQISKSLVGYINGIMKNMEESSSENQLSFGRYAPDKNEIIERESEDDIEDAEIVVEDKKIDNRTVTKKSNLDTTELKTPKLDLDDPISKLLLELYSKLSENEKTVIKSKAVEKYLEATDSEAMTKVHEQIFKSLEKIYVLEVMKEDKGIV